MKQDAPPEPRLVYTTNTFFLHIYKFQCFPCLHNIMHTITVSEEYYHKDPEP